MELQDIFHWLYVAGMALGAIYLASLGRNPRGVPRYEYFVASFIPIWSGLAYMSMSLPHDNLEQGKIAVAGQITHFARYLDWIADRTAENIIYFIGNIMTFGKSQSLSSRRRA